VHETSYRSMKRFADQFAVDVSSVLDVGSQDVNGSYKQLFPQAKYVGIDVAPGPNVNVVIKPGERFPFADNEFGAVISGQCLEHDPGFWMTLSEMGRVSCEWICVIAPGGGHYHAYPKDYWRFMEDAPLAWANLLGAKLIDKWRDEGTKWQDCGGIYRKSR